MTTATEWTKYSSYDYLIPGDEVRLSRMSKKLGGKVGIVEKKLRKNISIIVDGNPWRVSPFLIDEYRRGSAENLPAAKTMSVEVNPDGICDCVDGDVVLMWRGSFDVVRIIDVATLRCEGMDGRCKGKIYRYKADMFVQKLDQSRFSS